MSREHYNSEEVRERIHTLSEEWEQLTSASAEKGYIIYQLACVEAKFLPVSVSHML